MTTDDLRGLVETDLPDEALTTLVGAATETVEERVGPFGPVRETRHPSGPLIGLARRAVEILTILEGGLALDPIDYVLRPSGTIVDRIRGRWRGRVLVRYQPPSDAARRNAAIADLVRLHLDFHPGLTAARFGSWSESYATEPDYRAARDAILTELDGSAGFIR